LRYCDHDCGSAQLDRGDGSRQASAWLAVTRTLATMGIGVGDAGVIGFIADASTRPA
jgi:hypothetical protein